MTGPKHFYAHTLEGQSEEAWELLEVHLREVAALSKQHAAAFESGEWGYLAGLWHDLGKYQSDFQQRLRGERIQVEHAGLGAALASSKGKRGLSLSFAIAGHHAGLANWKAQGETGQVDLETRLRRNADLLDQSKMAIPAALFNCELPTLPSFLGHVKNSSDGWRRLELWTRFLFSALVDADRLATEAFCSPAKARLRRPVCSSVHDLSTRLDEKLEEFAANTAVNQLRARVLNDCRAAADQSPGLFSLTAPTGAGKTLASMSFALRHAVRHNLRRVIVVLPYTSIIEQNAKVYRDVLGNENVLEHHSNLDQEARWAVDGEVELRRRLAAENWDLPVIVTTTVQFFESLLSNHPSRCRKLHNIARSVIILDEVQSLPAGYLSCILDLLKELTTVYGCTVVNSTATQPALGRRDTLPDGLVGVREIVRDPEELAASSRRVRVVWPDLTGQPVSNDDLAMMLSGHQQVVAIVHLRKDARLVVERLPSAGRFHLSALMCPAHRREVLDNVRLTLARGEVCRLVATPLIEAGVDIDFPVAYRAFAGLDSMAQAAGRCNREGLCPEGGVLYVFKAETQPPAGVLRFGLDAAEAMLRVYGSALDIATGGFFEEYFRILYQKCELDRGGVLNEREALNFATVDSKVNLVDDGYSHPLVVPWADSDDRIARFTQREDLASRRALQPYLVQVRSNDLKVLERSGAIYSLTDGLWAVGPTHRKIYDRTLGLRIEADDWDALIV